MPGQPPVRVIARVLAPAGGYGEMPTGDPAAYRVQTPELAAWSIVHGAVMLWLDGQLTPIQSDEEFLSLVDRILSLHFA